MQHKDLSGCQSVSPPAKAAEGADEADRQPVDTADPIMAQGIPGPRSIDGLQASANSLRTRLACHRGGLPGEGKVTEAAAQSSTWKSRRWWLVTVHTGHTLAPAPSGFGV